jgi:hypothetical protein
MDRGGLVTKNGARGKRSFKFGLTSEDIALDNAISAAAARDRVVCLELNE